MLRYDVTVPAHSGYAKILWFATASNGDTGSGESNSNVYQVVVDETNIVKVYVRNLSSSAINVRVNIKMLYSKSVYTQA